MSIEDLLKCEIDIRITVGNKWLVYDDSLNGFIVYKQERYKRNPIALYSGNNIDDAIYSLIEGN